MSVSLSESPTCGAAVRAVGSSEFDIEARHGKYLSTRGANFLPAPHAPCAKPFTASIERRPDRIRHWLVVLANHGRACRYSVNPVKRRGVAIGRGSR
jgi:hypothetical protein